MVLLHAVNYEREALDKYVRNGVLTHERVTRWLQLIYHKEVHELKSVQHADLLAQERPAPYVKLYHSALLALVVEQPSNDAVFTPSTELADMIRYSDDRTCPETLLMDSARLREMRSEFRYIVTATTMLITARQAVKAAGTSTQMNDHTLQRITETLVAMSAPAELDACADHAVLRGPIKHILEFESALSDTAQASLLQCLAKCTAHDNPVRVLM